MNKGIMQVKREIAAVEDRLRHLRHVISWITNQLDSLAKSKELKKIRVYLSDSRSVLAYSILIEEKKLKGLWGLRRVLRERNRSRREYKARYGTMKGWYA